MIIGFFDSGLGGLLMMESLRAKYRYDDFIYVGDTENLPYGPKNKFDILANMEPYLLWLFEEKKCDYICIACNTASVKSLGLFIKKNPHYQNRFIDIVNPTIEYLKTVDAALVLATTGTVFSGQYKVHEGIKQIPMPGLVDLIEEFREEEALVMIDDALLYYPDIQYVMLGCTHYVFLKDRLSKKYPKKKFISQSDFVLGQIHKIGTFGKKGSDEYFVSKESRLYSQKYNKIFLPIELPN